MGGLRRVLPSVLGWGAVLALILALSWSQLHGENLALYLDFLVASGLAKYSFARRSLSLAAFKKHEFTAFCMLNWDVDAKRHAGETLVLFEDKSYTYQQIDEHVQSLAAELQQRYAVQPGDVVASALDLRPEGLVVLLACHLLGAIHAPVSPFLVEAQVPGMKEVLGDIAVMIVGRTGTAEGLWRVVVNNVFAYDLGRGAPAVGSGRVAPYQWRMQETVALMPTSGTGGSPKFVMTPRRSQVFFDQWQCKKSRFFMNGGWQEHSMMWSIFKRLPCGSTFILTLEHCRKVNSPEAARKWANLINKHAVDSFQLYAHVTQSFASIDIVMPTVKMVSVSGRAPNKLAARQASALWPNATWAHGYGMTEFMQHGGIMNTWPAGKGPPNDRFFDSVGYGLNGSLQNIKLIPIEDSAEEFDQQNVHELRFRLPYGAFSGYWRNPQLTSEAIDKDGYIITKDLAYVKNGFFYLVGRKDDAIKHYTMGRQLFPHLIEEVIQQHPHVSAVSVVAKRDASSADHLVACVVTDANISATALAVFSRDHGLAHWQIPAAFHFMESLPVTHMGWKVSRGSLKKIVAELPWSSLSAPGST